LEQQTDLEEEVATLIAEAVNLEKPVAELDPDMPLFGDGLGLDSIDVLEIALAVSRKYGFQLRSDDSANRRIFGSLRSLSAHIAQVPHALTAKPMSEYRRLLAIGLFCAYPLLNHVAAVYGEPRWAALGVALVAWGLTAGWLSAVSSVLVAAGTSRRRAVAWPAFSRLLLYTPPW